MQHTAEARADLPTLDRDHEPWVGHFPGLGTIRVAEDGQFDVTVETDSAGAEQALRDGWAQHLAWVRTGGRLSHGIVMVPPDGDRALLINGDHRELREVVRELLDREWRLLSDQPSHLRFDQELTAYPRAGLIMPQRESDGLSGEPIRDDTDSVLIEVAHHDQPALVAAIATIRGRAPGHEALTELTGHQRFESATRLFVRGVLAGPEPTAEEAMSEHLGLARIPMCTVVVKQDGEGDPIAQLIQWWSAR